MLISSSEIPESSATSKKCIGDIYALCRGEKIHPELEDPAVRIVLDLNRVKFAGVDLLHALAKGSAHL